MAKLFKWLMVMLIPLFSLTFASCGDDDKDEPGTSDKTEMLLIGEWSKNVSYGYHWVFLGNGTGYDAVVGDSYYTIDETFKWSVKGTTLTINWEGAGKEIFTIINVTADELIVKNDDHNDPYSYFTRVK
ncbi:MAG: lipocalin family protein [Clostridium sp.]|nr:lipocalin family protein [Clostridium sp.]